MKRIANNIFSSWKTTLLGLAIFGLVLYLVERDVFDAERFGVFIEVAAGAVGAWLAFISKDKLPRMGRRKDKDC